MTDWTFYSPSRRDKSAGDLLRAIPSRRNLRLERDVEDDGEKSVEAVRAAEQLFDLRVVLRLTNDPRGALRLTVRRADESTRALYRDLAPANAPKPADIQVYAELALFESAMEAGHVDLADDVVAGLEQVFPGGIAVSPMTNEVLCARELVVATDKDLRPWSHADARFDVDETRRDYLVHLLNSLPPSMGSLVRCEGGRVIVRGRVPAQVSREELQYAEQLLSHCASFAHAGHVRYREEGMWREATRIGPELAPLPAEWLVKRQGVVRGVIARLFGRGE